MAEPGRLRADRSVVTPLHIRLLGLVGDAEGEYGPIDLRLEGGTALSAYHLRHRESEDLDFFGGPAMNAADFRAFVEERLRADGLYVVGEGPASRGFAECLISDRPAAVAPAERQSIKLKFGRAAAFRLAEPVPSSEGIRIGSYRDLCAGKLHALCDRFEPKDFIDLHCILRRHDAGEPEPDENEMRRRVRALEADLRQTDPGLSAAYLGRSLARGLGRALVSEFPLRLLLPISEEDVQTTTRLAHDECARIAADHMREEGEPPPEDGS